MGRNKDNTDRLANGAILIIGTIQIWHVIGCRSRNRSRLPQCKGSNSPRHNVRRNGTPSATNTIANRQCNIGRLQKRQHKTKQGQLICIFTGSKIESSKASFMFIGVQGINIWRIILQNTIPWCITKECNKYIYTQMTDQ
jgi:hypothetical protein